MRIPRLAQQYARTWRAFSWRPQSPRRSQVMLVAADPVRKPERHRPHTPKLLIYSHLWATQGLRSGLVRPMRPSPAMATGECPGRPATRYLALVGSTVGPSKADVFIV